VNRILKPFIFAIAVVYIGVDAVFLTVARPIADWVSKRRILDGLRAWIVSLRPYPTLALFMVPLIVLEPLKPVAAYLVATGHVKVALTTFAVGEILKLVILERLFTASRDKLMLIPAFGWGYRKFCRVWNWLEATKTWQAARHWSKVAQYAVRSYATHLKASLKPDSICRSMRVAPRADDMRARSRRTIGLSEVQERRGSARRQRCSSLRRASDLRQRKNDGGLVAEIR
jgi:hypothetical protein